MKVLLINPPIEITKQKGEFISIIAPLGIAYIAAVLEKKGHEVKILDCLALGSKNPINIKRGNKVFQRFSPPEKYINKYIAEFNPEIVGISNLVSPTENETLKMAKKVKHIIPNVKIVIGGSNASYRANFLINQPNIDFVVVGEGEETLKELIENLSKKNLNNIPGLIYKNTKGKVIINPPRPFIKELDKLPFPAWHLLPMREYLNHQPAGIFVKKDRTITMITSRGCPNGCSFCTNEAMWGRIWRYRSVENVIKEIKILKKLYQIEEIQFIDNNISVHKERFIKLCQALKKERLSWIPSGGIAVLTVNPKIIKIMAESGCYSVQLGIEHGDLEMQKRIGKIVPLKATRELTETCHKYGIWTHGNFIVGLPGETKKTAYKSLEYAIKADLDSVSFFTALPTPGSKIYKEIESDRKINLHELRFYTSNAQCSEIPPSKIKVLIKIFFRKFLLFKIKRELNPKNMIRRLILIHSIEDIKFYFIMLRRFIQIEKVS